MKKEEMIVIIRTCKEQGTKEEVSFEYAVEKLSGYWVGAENLLMQGAELFTPYANYQLKN
jgi:hypothetical protein